MRGVEEVSIDVILPISVVVLKRKQVKVTEAGEFYKVIIDSSVSMRVMVQK